MSPSAICIEGGGHDGHAECRRGFRKLFEQCGFEGRMPRLIACGSRNEAFDDFKTQMKQQNLRFVALLVDSEDPVENIERTWDHLKKRDQWERPADATDDQVLLMATCMETWIVADRATLRSHYKKIQESALPPLSNLERRDRHLVHDALVRATRDCPNGYTKGTRSFEVLGLLNPATLETHLPSFVRILRVLREQLNAP